MPLARAVAVPWTIAFESGWIHAIIANLVKVAASPGVTYRQLHHRTPCKVPQLRVGLSHTDYCSLTGIVLRLLMTIENKEIAGGLP